MGDNNIKSHIDRVMVGQVWHDTYTEAWAQNVSTIHSDHDILVTHVAKEESKVRAPFRFINTWNSQADYDQVISIIWNSHVDCTLIYILTEKLKAFHQALSRWN